MSKKHASLAPLVDFLPSLPALPALPASLARSLGGRSAKAAARECMVRIWQQKQKPRASPVLPGSSATALANPLAAAVPVASSLPTREAQRVRMQPAIQGAFRKKALSPPRHSVSIALVATTLRRAKVPCAYGPNASPATAPQAEQLAHLWVQLLRKTSAKRVRVVNTSQGT